MPDAPRIVERGLDLLNVGLGIFDAELNLLACNQRFGELQRYSLDLCVPGTSLERMFRFSAERGDFGPGDVDSLVSERMAELSRWCAARQAPRGIDRRSPEGRVLNLCCRPIAGGGVALIYEDVTDARAVEEALRASEQRSALVARAAAEGIYDWNVTNDDLYVSSRLNEIFGFRGGELRSEEWYGRVHPDDAERYRSAVRAHFKGETPRLECEYRIRDQRGQHVWVLDRGIAVRNDAGRVVRLVGAVSDVTVQKDAEAALRTSEERYALAIEAVKEAVYDWDLVADQIYYSPRLYATFGLTSEELRTPQDWIERVHPDDLERYRQATIDHFKGRTERFDCEHRYRRKDGSWGWAHQHGLALRDASGRAYRMAGSAGDITEQKELEQALRAAETRFVEATEAVTAGIALFDADDRLVMCNSRFRDSYSAVADLMRPGVAFRDILQASIDRGVVADARADPQGWLARRLERHLNPGTPLEWQLDDGRWLHVSEHRTAEGGIIGIYADITARKQAEHEAVAAKERAERALAELQEAQEKLIHAEKMASLGQLTAGIAHEIKNPLNFVNNFADLSVELRDELGELLAPIVPTLEDAVRADLDEAMTTLAGNLRKIAEHGRRADRIVKNMLLHSREDPGELRPVDLNGLVAESLNLAYHGARAERPGFTVEMIKDLDPAVGEVWCQPQDLTRVFLNLISNGFYAAHQRKAEGDQAGLEPALTIATRNLEDRIEVRVRDNGPGIPEHVRSRIFQPFFTTKPAGEGTGLGLSLSYDIIVKQHGGLIDVASRPGEFTEFVVTLPRVGSAKAGVKDAAAE